MARYRRAKQVAAMDPDRDRIEIVRRLVQFEFPWDMQRSLELALFRTFAVPSIGILLDRTGEFGNLAQKRYDDTLLLLYHVWLGDDAEQRTIAADHLNFIHGHYRISNDDFRYVLATFVVVPIRWLQRFGWRAPSEVEIAAWTNVMADMGTAMRISDTPTSYAAFSELMDEYEAAHFAYQAANERVARATLDMLVGWYPRPARPVMRRLVPGLLEDPVLSAVGLDVPTARTRRFAHAAMRGRARAVRWMPPRRDGRPYEPAIRTYVEEPAVTALGPTALVRRRATKS